VSVSVVLILDSSYCKTHIFMCPLFRDIGNFVKIMGRKYVIFSVLLSSANKNVTLTLSSNAILSIVLIILEAESFKLRQLMGLTSYVFASLAN